MAEGQASAVHCGGWQITEEEEGEVPCRYFTAGSTAHCTRHTVALSQQGAVAPMPVTITMLVVGSCGRALYSISQAHRLIDRCVYGFRRALGARVVVYSSVEPLGIILQYS